MALDSTKWQYRTDKSIRYIGPAHGAAGANYVSVYELHRWLQDLADDASSANDDYLDITIPNPSEVLMKSPPTHYLLQSSALKQP